MRSLPNDILRQIEAYADNELVEASVRDIETLISQNAEAAKYFQALVELRTVPQVALDALDAHIDFASLEDKIMQAVFHEETAQAEAPRDFELEQLCAAWADGELQDPTDIQRVFRYLAENPAAHDGLEGLREVQRVTRAYVAIQSENVDFEALQQRTMQAIGLPHNPDNHAKEETNVVSFERWTQRFKVPLAAVAGIAAAVAIMLPLTLNQAGNTNITNHYYLTDVDNMDVEPGYSGTIVRGTPKAAPIVWITDDADTVPASKQVAPTTADEPNTDGDENHPDDDVLDI